MNVFQMILGALIKPTPTTTMHMLRKAGRDSFLLWITYSSPHTKGMINSLDTWRVYSGQG